MNAYGYRTNVGARRNTSALGTIIRFLRAVFEVVCERVSAFELRVVAVAVSFAISLGIVGGMECGAVPLYIGLPVCIVLAVAALLTHIDD